MLYMKKKSVLRKGRTLNITVDDLLASKRLEIAVKFFKEDPMLLKSILIELGLETQEVTKNSVIREMMRHNGLDRGEIKPKLALFNDFCSYNIWWPMSQQEKIYYSKNPKDNLSQEESWKLFKN